MKFVGVTEQRFNPHLIEYHSLLEPFIGRFGREQIFVVGFDHLVSGPQALGNMR